jgi:hypothetical protein
MLYRKFCEVLEGWYKKDKKLALLIDGARQIGKTTLIRQFAKAHYGSNFVEINFITTPSAKEIFSGDLSADGIISKLTLFLRRPLQPHKTLIFFDEVQECPEVRTAIKFLVDDGRFDYIQSGSLLGINYKEIKSYAVGYEEIKTMYPMDFEEFAIACGVQEETFGILKNCYDNKKPVDEFIHKQMSQLFTYYTIIGGMPAAVQEFVNSKDMGRVVNIQKDILKLYRLDITKYSKNDKDRITHIFDTLPAELNNKNKRFMLSDLAKSARMDRYESSFNWLTDAGIALPCYNLTEVKQPVEINKQHNLFKFFFADTGLLCAMCSGDVQYQIVNGNYSINEGSIMENMYAQQLKSNGFELYYYDKQKVGEVDFVVEQHASLIPVEIKSGNDYKSHKALNNLLGIDEFNISNAYVFCKGNIEVVNKITYLPFYMIMFFKKENLLSKIKFEL